MSQYSHIPIWDAYAAASTARGEYEQRETAHLNRMVRSGRIVAVVADERPVAAYVSDNRWVADCLICGGGIGVAPDRDVWVCWECGTGYPIEWPTQTEMNDGVVALRERIPRLRNWTPSVESPSLLVEQNETLGIDHHSWTTPRTWTAGEVVTSGIMNTHVRDNLLETCPALVTTAEDITVADGANSLVRLAVGSANDYLRVITGSVSWST